MSQPNPRRQYLRAASALVLTALCVVGAGADRDQADRPAAERPSLVYVARLQDEAITPVTARFLARAIRQAGEDGAQCLVIELDTPGGLLDSTRKIIREILESRACIVVYVSPGDARAASAGGFILLSAHIAAMAPTTRVGAMHPVQVGGLPTMPEPSRSPDKEDDEGQQPPPGTPSEQKIVNDTVAWARGLAELRGRNAEWAERAVRESIVVRETEALEQGVVDLVVADLQELLEKIDGRKIELPQGTVRLRTKGARISRIEMWWGEQFLATISDPNVAFLLLIFGFYGVLFEFYSPGWGIAGTLGAVCLVLAFLGLAILPINYVGLILIAAALAMFAAEVFVTSYGALTAGGLVCLILGGLMLVESPGGFMRVSLAVVIPVAGATAAITIFLLSNIFRAHRGRVQTGVEGLIGTRAVAVDEFSPEEDHFTGQVRVHGELWRAACPEKIVAGQTVTVTDSKGLTLSVRPEGQTSQ